MKQAPNKLERNVSHSVSPSITRRTLKPNTHRRRRRDSSRVESRRRQRCVHGFATIADGFGDANAQRSRMGHDCRRVCSHRRHDETVAN